MNFQAEPKELKSVIVRYYKCAKIILDENNSEPIQNGLRHIINMQDLSGNTPLHLAAKDWPQRIVKSLLRFGADMSIQN